MASCSLEASNFRIPGVRVLGSRVWTEQKQLRYVKLETSQCPQKMLTLHCGPSLKNQPAIRSETGSVMTKYSGLLSQLVPKPHEVANLLSDICDTNSIEEFDLKLGGFWLHLKRDLHGRHELSVSSSPAIVVISTAAEPPELSTSSLVISKKVPSSSSDGIQTLLDVATDEGLMILQSPRVGFFRRSRTIKGKRASPPCKEKQIVKEGQVLCYIEQLGGELPIECDISGEVVKILREDGDPVGYGDALIAILPSFPGSKKLQ